MEIAAQALSIIAMTGNILSYQIKKTKILCLVLAVCGFLFATSYFMLGAMTSACLNMINIARGLCASSKRFKNKPFFVIISLLYVVATVFTFEGIISVFLMAAQIIGTWAMFFATPVRIRQLQIFAVSPIWLINNIFVFSVGGILCEIFTIISSLIFWVRQPLKK